MKKKVSLLLALGLVCTTVLSGCGGGSTPTEPQTIADATTEAAGSEASTAVSYTHLTLPTICSV